MLDRKKRHRGTIKVQSKDAVSEELDSESDYSHPTLRLILPVGYLCSVVTALTYLCPQL